MNVKVLYVLVIFLAVICANLAESQNNSGFYSTPYAVINAVIDDGDHVWVGSDRGISKIHTVTGEINSYIDAAASLGDVTITALALDDQGRFWVGTYDNGVAMYDFTDWTVYTKDNSDLPNDRINDIIVNTSGNIYIGTKTGFTVFDGESWTVYKRTNSDLPNNTVNALASDQGGTVWIGTQGGLAKYDGENFTVYKYADSDLPGNTVNTLTVDSRGTVWIGTTKGLAQYNGENWMTYSTTDSDLPSDTIDYLGVDARGNTWIGTSNQVTRFDGTNWTVYNADNTLLPNRNITCITGDSKGNMWIGTEWGIVKTDGEQWISQNTGSWYGGGTWEQVGESPSLRIGSASGVVNGKIYIFGGDYGYLEHPDMRFSGVEEYDPDTNTLTIKQTFPDGRRDWSVSVVNGIIYAIGGYTMGFQNRAQSTTYAYDPTTDTWTEKASMPTKRGCHCAAVVDGKIYIIGGAQVIGGAQDAYWQLGGEMLSTVEEYDPATDTWTSKSSMLTGRRYATASVINGKIYVMGGAEGESPVASVEEYDPATDTWTEKGDMLTPLFIVSSSVVNGKIYTISGCDKSWNVKTNVDEYDPATNTWIKRTNISAGRAGHTCAAMNGKIYVFGGTSFPNTWDFQNSNYFISLIEVFDPGSDYPTLGEVSNPKDFTLMYNYSNPSTTTTYQQYQQDMGLIEYGPISEASGIAASRKNEDVLWTHNDSGDSNRIFALDTQGRHLGVYTIEGADNRDWEDMAVGPGPVAGQHYIYIGEIGDNSAQHDLKLIYRVPEPDVHANQSPIDTTITGVETITFQYPDGNRDAETLMVDPLTKDIYVVSKREYSVRVYLATFPQSTTETIILDHAATLPLSLMVGGDISASGLEILMKSYDYMFYWSRTPEQSLPQVLENEPVIVPYIREPQGEAVCWASDGMGYYTISEEYQRSAHLYFYPSLTTVVATNEDKILSFKLNPNYPNPFNPSTTITYQLEQSGMVNLVIYDLLGRKMTTLVDEAKAPGSYSVKWNADGYASGVYFYRLELGGSKVLTQKMMLVK
ncbi:kelch repeat-containing protein [Candidatus Omnitrophota bacterium]